MSLEHSPGRQLLRPRQVCAKIGRSRTSLWRDVKAGVFPAPIQIGRNSIAWDAAVIDAWITSRPQVNYAAPKPEVA